MMARMRKVFLGILLVVLGVVGWDLFQVTRYCFWLSNELLSLPLTPKRGEELGVIFNQSFSYLDEGSTSRVFASEDGTVVIKLFLDKNYTCASRKYLPFLNQLGAYRKKLKMQVTNYQSCSYAYAFLRMETGMVYYHLKPTDHFNQTLILRDCDGQERLLNLDEDVYVVQKRAVVAGNYIKNCVKNNQLKRAKMGISNLLELTLMLYRQGIVMVDLQFTSNFGFIDDVVVRIDTEHLVFKESWKKEYSSHLKEELEDFRNWIKINCPPSILSHFDSEVSRLVDISMSEIDMSKGRNLDIFETGILQV